MSIFISWMKRRSNEAPKPDQLETAMRLSPQLAGHSPQEIVQVFAIKQFIFMFLLCPAIATLAFASVVSQ